MRPLLVESMMLISFLAKGTTAVPDWRALVFTFGMVLATGLFVRTLQNLKTANTGLVTSRLITFQAEPGSRGYGD